MTASYKERALDDTTPHMHQTNPMQDKRRKPRKTVSEELDLHIILFLDLQTKILYVYIFYFCDMVSSFFSATILNKYRKFKMKKSQILNY